ncbi:LuxR C-terminal-related transcriptional regulator [Nocardia sp. CDC159]|uniref:LuxR C-terminal-related transcriptional regulator n=1 Tax=Nocardia pulmonis TaxID=2951408 RepID=A0A9X2E7K0_9NOCA|nr:MULTISPECIES: LuxR C-terminal-related transcriptional regulator [Nocardia]MCM6773131.1 LuxR C-terminal-related transcriptional regulator [Nocardia pulmonis]MCM6785566.1 LuxR C-terminal-related transcriptional regulator [Nocardia sp. CDC159]
MLAEHRVRLVTLTGTAGVGKTQLAREALRTSAFRESAVVVELSEAIDRAAAWALVRAAVRRDLRPPDTDRDAEALLADVAADIGADRRALLLDNCDPVAGRIARDIALLLQRCPELVILATTRVPLNLDPERVFCVLPLPVGSQTEDGPPGSAPASRLLLDRIDSRYRGAITLADQLLLDEIAQVLDGVPLALQLAAATIARVGVVRTLRLVEAGGDLVSAGYADTPPRHRSMHAAVAWGVGGLDGSAVELLLRLSLCHCALDRETALLLGGADTEATTTALAALVHHSLLDYRADRHGAGSYALVAPVRAWCRRMLGADPVRARRIRADHADRLSELAETVGDSIRRNGPGWPLPETAAGLARDFLAAVGGFIEAGRPERAVRLAAVLEEAWIQLGYLSDAERVVANVLATRSAESSSAATRRCLQLLGRWALRTGRDERALRLLTEAETSSRRAGDGEAARCSAALLGEALRRHGRRTEARALLRAAGEAAGPEFDPGCGSIEIALALLALPDPPGRDDTMWTEARRRALEPEFHRGGAAALNELAASQLSRDTLRRARQLYLSVLDHADAEWCVLEAIRAVEGCARVHALAGEEHLEIAALLSLAAEHLRRRKGIPQLDAPGTAPDGVSWRDALGDKVFCEIRRSVSGMELSEVIDRVRAAPEPADDAEPPLAVLTPRQREVAELVATGLTNRMIASRLGLSEWTVVNHLRQVMIKLDCPSRLHVALVVQREAALEHPAADFTPEPDSDVRRLG